MRTSLLLVAIALAVTSCDTAATSTSSSAGAVAATATTAAAATGSPPAPVATGPAEPPTSPAPTATAAPPTTPPTTPAPPAASPSAPAPAAPAGVVLPNPALTPGEVFNGATTAQVCTPGYARSVRHVEPVQYQQVYGAYAIPYPEPRGTYELDHLIPLELGGDNANANLWPQPASPSPGFHEKDTLENTMHAMVCSGRLDLREAQHAIAVDWYAAYLRYSGG